MKRKLSFLMFGLLLAVGWTNVASAQSYVFKATDMKTNGEWWTYEWVDANGVTQTSPYVELNPKTNKYEAPQVTDPYQIYGLLRAVYMDTRLPGPFFSAYKKDAATREDPVYYGAMDGGWNISKTPLSNLTITTTRYGGGFGGYSYVWLQSIIVRDPEGNILTQWNYTQTFNQVGWSNTGTLSNQSNSYGEGYRYISGGDGTITIPASLLSGNTSVTVEMRTQRRSANCQLSVNGNYMYFANTNTWYTIKTNVVGKNSDNDFKPEHEGYTALIVSLYNDTTKIHDESNDPYQGAWEFADKTEAIQFITNNIQFVKLLTDGLRVGSGLDAGTVFNCSGTYNRFFFLGKGQARKKAPRSLQRITEWYLPEFYCNEGPFKYMYEEFSPTSGDAYSDISDFYMEMMDGKVYPVVHDCASVIQNKHQFSMSGKKGTQAYAMSGMNFFIPDYRLLYYYVRYNPKSGGSYFPVDGRDMNAYEYTDTVTGNHANYYWANDQSSYRSHWSVYWANYNPQHAPLVGLYTLTLDAEAKPCENYANPGNTNYVITLDWTSSLNEMSGHDVDQTYVIYEVVTNEDGSTRLDSITTVSNTTTYDFEGKLWPQGEHSESHTYIIMGYPTDNDHPSFIAWSNEDQVVIPGLNDFLELGLSHYESDFDVPNMKNWYRNFLVVNNDGYVGLTTHGIFEGDSVFNLVRFEDTDTTITKQVARLKFENQSDGRVKYTVNYVDENNANTQEIEAEKYALNRMDIPTTGYLTIKNDKDIIIQPNGYDVNFLSIQVQAGSYNQTWTSSQNNLPSGWSVSDGSMWVLENGARYLEGGGYILIPASVVGNYTTATVTIRAYGDPGKTAKITVNGTTKALYNGSENAANYVWNLTAPTSGFNAPSRAESVSATVADGTTHNGNLPVYGNYFEVVQKNQMIYSASLLSQAGIPTGATITSLTFYPYPGNGSFWDDPSGINFYGGNVKLSLGTTSSSYFSGNATLNENVTLVGQTGTITANSSATEFTITFTTPYTYNGGNLLVQIDTEAGTYSPTYFMGQNQSSNVSVYSYGSTSHSAFLPKATFTYTTEGGGGPINPTVDGVVRMANLRIVDQFAEQIPNTNDHPYRYTYILKLANSDKESSMVPVPVQHTGAEVQGYYTEGEMLADTDPANFLTENVISAQVDMTLSPTSAPYYYTINSVKDNVPEHASDTTTFVSRLQRRSAGDYQEMQKNVRILGEASETPIVNPYNGKIYEPGEHNYFDFREVTGQPVDYLSYVPIVWTNGIKRHYFTTDSLHNSYGAPIWKVKRGDVDFSGFVQRQVSSTGGWNPSVNWWVKNADGSDSTAYGLYFVEFTANGILPVCDVDYEPYMFRVWMRIANDEMLRNYEWQYNTQGKPIKIVDDGQRPGLVVAAGDDPENPNPNAGQWFLLDEKMCNGVEDLTFQRTITTNYAGNLQFAGPLNNFKPELVARFYYKKRGAAAPAPSGLRGPNDDDNVGYVVLKGVRPDPETAVHEVVIVGEVVDQIFYNAQGMQSNRPFEGINIVVTRYSDGTTNTSKVRY